MRIDWRAICGPALATAAALVAAAADRTLLDVPGLAPLFVCIAAVAASLSGLASGMVSAAIAVTASALLFLHHRGVAGYDGSELAGLAVLALTAAATALIAGLSRQKMVDALSRERARHATAARPAPGPGQIDIGGGRVGSGTPR